MTEIPTGDEYILDMIEDIDDIALLNRIYDAALVRARKLEVEDGNERQQYRKNDDSDFRVGDTVFFQRGISPKYLIGLSARVTKVNAKSVVVTVPDEPAYRRFRGARNVRCPKGIVAKRV